MAEIDEVPETMETNNGPRAEDIEAVDAGLDALEAASDDAPEKKPAAGDGEDPEDEPESEETEDEEPEDEQDEDSGEEKDAEEEDQNPGEGEKPAADKPLEDENGPIVAPPDIHPKNLSNFRRLEAVARTAVAEKDALAEKVSTLEASGAGKLPEPVEKELTELRQFRQLHDLRNDPDFVSRYDGQVKTHEESVATILKKNGAKDEQVEAMLKTGLLKYDSKWWDDHVFSKIPSLEADRVKRALMSITDLGEAKEKELIENAAKVGEITSERERRDQEEFESDRKTIETRSRELFGKMPWAQRQEVPANATPEHKKAIAEHNKSVEHFEGMFNRALYPQDARHRAEVAVAAITATRLASVVQDLDQQLTALREENIALKKGRRLPGTKHPKGGRQAPPPEDGFATGLGDDNDAAIDRGLDEVSGG